jgi:hypothetical protein
VDDRPVDFSVLTQDDREVVEPLREVGFERHRPQQRVDRVAQAPEAAIRLAQVRLVRRVPGVQGGRPGEPAGGVLVAVGRQRQDAERKEGPVVGGLGREHFRVHGLGLR